MALGGLRQNFAIDDLRPAERNGAVERYELRARNLMTSMPAGHRSVLRERKVRAVALIDAVSGEPTLNLHLAPLCLATVGRCGS
jgi:hypothetical protein